MQKKRVSRFHHSATLSLLNTKFSDIALTETWLNDQKNLKSLEIDGYKFEPNNRIGRTGGGVAFYVDENLSYTLRDDICFSTCESLLIEIPSKHGKNLIIAAIYRPDDNIDDFTDELNVILSKMDAENKTYWLTGDFNIDLLKYKNKTAIEIHYFRTLISLSFLLQPE